jgi:hypothetical protein
MSTGVGDLMCECGHKVEVMVEGRALGHEPCRCRAVIGIVQPVFDRDAKPFEEGQRVGNGGADRRDLLLQRVLGAIDLIAVEDDEAAREEAGAAIAFAARFSGGIAALDLLPEDDMGADRTFADLAAIGAPLLIGRPDARGVAAGIGGGPEDKAVDAGIAPTGTLVGRMTGTGMVPGHPPFARAGLNRGDKLGGDGGIDVVTGLHGMVSS